MAGTLLLLQRPQLSPLIEHRSLPGGPRAARDHGALTAGKEVERAQDTGPRTQRAPGAGCKTLSCV